MVYKNFGNTGIKVSALGFGCMRLPGDNINGSWEPDQDKIDQMLMRAYELGVNYYDTAPGYCGGKSEIAVGKALKNVRNKVYFSTKCDLNGDNVNLRKELERSLSKLDTGYIDFYHFWGIGKKHLEQYILNTTNIKDGPVGQALKAKEEGLIKHLSFSFHDSPEVMLKIIDTGLFETVLCQYNLLNRENEEGIKYAQSKGLGVVVMGPVAGGRIGAPSDTIASMLPVKAQSSAEIALRFVISAEGVSSALSGMKNIEMVEENCRVLSNEEALSEDENKKVRAALAENKKLAELYCTGCKYCMPCPQNINISKNFEAMNFYKVYGLLNHAKNVYNDIRPDKNNGERADKCTECGICESKCPQKIEIRKQLREVAAALGEAV